MYSVFTSYSVPDEDTENSSLRIVDIRVDGNWTSVTFYRYNGDLNDDEASLWYDRSPSLAFFTAHWMVPLSGNCTVRSRGPTTSKHPLPHENVALNISKDFWIKSGNRTHQAQQYYRRGASGCHIDIVPTRRSLGSYLRLIRRNHHVSRPPLSLSKHDHVLNLVMVRSRIVEVNIIPSPRLITPVCSSPPAIRTMTSTMM